MSDELGGLPAHPLVVHLPVVLIPLATLGCGRSRRPDPAGA
jgi:hypothetical protein